ncbi:hypothetical protein BJ973_002939 [Actinoplanes tereljensis]|uniref:Orc1-like AAA ATPase domain-containing protein n=1 Tax=Paractinoplanes tereljensis TaxID=571912 RepID=A0A919NRA5_9ACTN|nr:ATP-binding protein [Actinoplanes tereljensis]GIF22616.1 hypothetical protein Ate02nite_53460 [Actinoplanes tereljensis]
MTDPPLTSESLRTALEARFAARRTAVPLPRGVTPYLDAAAVLHVFDPVRIRPYGDTSEPSTVLNEYSVPAVGWRHAGLRCLRTEHRRNALRRLGTTGRMRAALKVNPDRERTDMQLMFERWLDGKPIVLDDKTYVELENLRQLYEWGLEGRPGLPPRSLVEAARRRRSAVALFEHLVDDHFTGRAAERAAIDLFVHAPDPATGSMLAIWGPGGSGKTALIGRFLMDHLDAGHLPFAYLPFDSETLDLVEPFTVLVSAAAQLDTQTVAGDDASPESRAFNAEVELYRDRRGSLQRRASEYSERVSRLSDLSKADESLYDAFARLVPTGVPFVLVFDTFEEVVYRSEEDFLGFWAMLDHLHRRLPRLRILIAGRGHPDLNLSPIPVYELLLGELPGHEAVTLLRRLGVTDNAVAERITGQIGGNPLSLRLAARVAGEAGPGKTGLDGLSTWAIGAELIRGQLYQRLLEHIHDTDVRTLAHPGMVLRRVDAAVIRRVLAPACELGQISPNRAAQLLDGLRREQTLVSIESDGSLHYREEVRRPVLDLLVRDQPAQVRAIHTYAVRYYSTRDEPADRAEELYHRMMLDEPAAALDGRWTRSAEPYLRSAVDELPPGQRRWLAGHMSIRLPAEVLRIADLDEWERLTARKTSEHVRHGGPESVLQLLGARTERTPDSPLFTIEARALFDLGRHVDGAGLLDRALAGYPLVGNQGRLAELLWLRGQAAEELGDVAGCLEFLQRLAEVTDRMRTRLAYAQTLTEILGVRNPENEDDPSDPAVGPLRDRLAGALDVLRFADVDRERSLIRLALCRLGPHYPDLLAELFPVVVYDLAFLASRGVIDLRTAIAEVIAELPELALPDGQADPVTVVEIIVRQLRDRTGADTGALVQAVLRLLRAEHASLSGAALAGIDDYREAWELEVTREVSG